MNLLREACQLSRAVSGLQMMMYYQLTVLCVLRAPYGYGIPPL